MDLTLVISLLLFLLPFQLCKQRIYKKNPCLYGTICGRKCQAFSNLASPLLGYTARPHFSVALQLGDAWGEILECVQR